MCNINVLIPRPRFGQKKNSILVDSKKPESAPTATVSSVRHKRICRKFKDLANKSVFCIRFRGFEKYFENGSFL